MGWRLACICIFYMITSRTCTNMPREKIDIALKEAKEAGIQNILALRGGKFSIFDV